MEKSQGGSEGHTSTKKGDGGLTMKWDLVDVLAQTVDEQSWPINNLVALVDEGCSVPFIARYRKEQTNHMEADKIRNVIAKLEALKNVQVKAINAVKQIEKTGKLTASLKNSLQQAKTLEQIDILYAPYKTGAKTTLAERARKLGLESALTVALKSPEQFQMQQYVRPNVKGLSTVAEVQKGIQHILTDIIAKDITIGNKLRKITKNSNISIGTAKKEATDSNRSEFDTYSLYFDFHTSVKNIKPHQVLAINRAESLKVLTVKLSIPDDTVNSLKLLCQRKWVTSWPSMVATSLIQPSIDEACSKRLLPLIIRETRSSLTKTAEKASVDVFAQNLRRLLLTPPVRGKVTMGLDPGFRHGCKMAVTSPTGQILQTGVVYLHGNQQMKEAVKMVEMIKEYRCETIALGNGTACRETEAILSDLITRKSFGHLNVMYCIVNEDGASIYSVSPDAEKEMPNLDPNLRSAVSIARRLQDPLVELVKIEPKHIGVGMYQHDVHGKFLKEALDGVVEECVSFVGVDLNVCSESLLRKISGLNVTRAKNIIEYRERNRSFVNREQLLEVKGLGPKSYQQCAGFVRVCPESVRQDQPSAVAGMTGHDDESTNQVGVKRKATGGSCKSVVTKKRKIEASMNPLDRTWIHPESYHIAKRVLLRAHAKVDDIGTVAMTTKIQGMLQKMSTEKLAQELDVGLPTITLIIDGLQQPMGYDIRAAYDKPLFKSTLQSIDDLKSGQVVTGRVTNMTHFGAFVDIGVGRDGLIHNSNMKREFLSAGQQLGPGDKVEVKVLSVSSGGPKVKISLQLCRPVV